MTRNFFHQFSFLVEIVAGKEQKGDCEEIEESHIIFFLQSSFVVSHREKRKLLIKKYEKGRGLNGKIRTYMKFKNRHF